MRRLPSIFILVSLVLCTISCNNDSRPIRIGYLNIVASLPLFVAEENDYFEGLEVEFFQMASSNQLVDATLTGNLDFIVECSAAPVLAVEYSSPGRLQVFSVSEITEDKPFDAIISKIGSEINTINDLEGKTIGVFPGSTASNLLKKHLMDRGIDVSKINFLPIPPPNQLASLESGAIDALHPYEPTVTIALLKGDYQKVYGSVYAKIISPNPQGVAVVSKEFNSNNPEISLEVILAFERAFDFIENNEIEARKILEKRLKLDKETASKTSLLFMLPSSKIKEDIFQQYANTLSELGELDGMVEVNNLLWKK